MPQKKRSDIAARLASFDEATRRQAERDLSKPQTKSQDRGWKREDLYDRHAR